MDQILDSHTTEEHIELEYAGFWIRFVAVFIDGILLMVVQQAVSLVITGDTTFANAGSPNGLVTILNLVIGAGYAIGMESSAKQATLGKMAVGIKVGDEYGNRITVGKAVGRYFSKLLSAITLGIGFIMAAFDNRKQALHDRIVGTVVFYGRS